jgi:peroxiredoxin family protein
METYYGRNTLYRLLRPIAIAELIERQITYADFSVDYAAIDLLRFKKAAFMALSDSDTINDHPKASWNFQREHLFSGTLSKLINELIIQDVKISNQERVMYFHEFEALVLENSQNFQRFSPLKEILDDFEISKKPIFWIRLVCFGYICNEYTEIVGHDIGFKKKQFDVKKLLSISQDDYTRSNTAKFQVIFQTITKMDL